MIEVVNIKTDDYDVYIGRGSIFGNPYSHLSLDKTRAMYKVNTRDEAIKAYEKWITEGDGKFLLEHLDELVDKRLGCYCKPKKCHGDVLKKLIENKNKKGLDL